ncbi:MAG: 50S ribosomal protein L9 [Alphaproteobacteria bacterium]|nr:MAG: 50S ribosomal protein L9 [Alphaproteobacteria bacterium]
MEIILLQKISKLGNMGDTVRVKQGFGRNFLIPTGKALRATKENKAFFEETKAKLLEENKEAIEKAEKFRTEVESLKLAVVRSASDTGILYGSVTTRDISNLISAEGVTVSRKDIALEQPIKELGIYDVNIIFHPEVESKIKLRVVRSLGDNTFETEENSITSKNSDEINESLLEDGVSFKTEEVNSEEEAPQTLPENELTEQRDGE